jgi:hypothetical protein
LILDEWLLYPLKETEARDLLEIAEARYNGSSSKKFSDNDILSLTNSDFRRFSSCDCT